MLRKLKRKISSFTQLLFSYPRLSLLETDYDSYWRNKRGSNLGYANKFQSYRAGYIASRIEENSTVLDIGCGDGAVLLNMQNQKQLELIAADISDVVLDFLSSKGIKTIRFDTNSFSAISSLPKADYILMLEVLEHMQNPEKFLKLISERAIKGIFFSFPNTGYISYRLRFLLGRFPVQWRTHPGEHLRFWTYRDLKWWLKEMELSGKSNIHVYEGVSCLNKILPSIFGAAFIVEIKK
ncbi:MAG: class I SAM-dependent methyltransferase [Cyanobacteria bacterium J06581_3]